MSTTQSSFESVDRAAGTASAKIDVQKRYTLEEQARRYPPILETAMRIAQAEQPEAGVYRQAAFANSVAYLCTGWSGGYGGPSIREHTTCKVGVSRYRNAGEWSFEDACRFTARWCFGRMNFQHRVCVDGEHCFGDDPQDVEILRKIRIPSRVWLARKELERFQLEATAEKTISEEALWAFYDEINDDPSAVYEGQ